MAGSSLAATSARLMAPARQMMSKDFIALGADRLGTSRIVKAVKAMEK